MKYLPEPAIFIVLISFLVVSTGWYLFWIQPNDAKLAKIHACMGEKYADLQQADGDLWRVYARSGTLSASAAGNELDHAIYTSCVRQLNTGN